MTTKIKGHKSVLKFPLHWLVYRADQILIIVVVIINTVEVFFYKNTISHTVTDDNAHFEFVFRRKFRFFSFGLDKHLLRNVKKVFFLFLNLFSDWNEFWIFFSVLNIFFGTKQYLKQNKNLEKTMQMNETVPFFALEGSRHKTNVGFSFFSVEISVLFLFVLMEIS